MPLPNPSKFNEIGRCRLPADPEALRLVGYRFFLSGPRVVRRFLATRFLDAVFRV